SRSARTRDRSTTSAVTATRGFRLLRSKPPTPPSHISCSSRCSPRSTPDIAAAGSRSRSSSVPRRRSGRAAGSLVNSAAICQDRDHGGTGSVLHDAYELIGDPGTGPFLFTCEHAEHRLPGWGAAPADLPALDGPWGWARGAADRPRWLARRCGSGALLSRFSRLVCDANREPDEASFVVSAVQGHAFSFNRGVDGAERERRRARYFDPYHAAIDRALAARAASGTEVRLCSIHSFTPIYDGRARPVGVGVLFRDSEAPAE